MTPTITVLAEGLRFPEGPVVLNDGSVVVSEMAAGRLTRIADGTSTSYAELGGGPNGIVVRGDHLVVCQNGGSSWGVGAWPIDLPGAVQIFRPTGPSPAPEDPRLILLDADRRVSTFARSFVGTDGQRRPLARPSDICPDGDGGFYLTDGGATRGRERQLTGVLHASSDGEIRELVYPLEDAQRGRLLPDGSRLYVAETRTRRIWCFDIERPGRLAGGRGFATVPSGGPLNVGGADGLCVDGRGNVVAATLGTGGVTVFAPDGRLVTALAMDDPMTTNAAYDPRQDRLLVTLASTGRVLAVADWTSVVRR